MKIDVQQEKERARMTLSGKIDEHGSEELKKRFYELNLSNVKELVLDFHGVVYIGSACIGKLLLFYKEMFDKEGKIRITGVTPAIHEMLRVVKIDSIIEVTPAGH